MEEHVAGNSRPARDNALQFGSAPNREASISGRERRPALFFFNAFSKSRTLASVTLEAPPRTAKSPDEGAQVLLEGDRTSGGARGIVMLIESTEHFHASAAIAIRRGPNEVAESDYARLPPATRTKLRILQEHGVVCLHSPVDVDQLDAAASDE